MRKGDVKKLVFLHPLFRGEEKMRRMNKLSPNKAKSFIWGYPTAYEGTPRAMFVYSIKHKNAVFVCL